MEISQSRQKKGKKKKPESNVRDLWDTKQCGYQTYGILNICMLGIPEGMERENGIEGCLMK